MVKVVIYTTEYCPYCLRAKALLSNKNVSYKEIHVDDDEAKLQEMIKKSGRRTVPQIFIDDKSIGGFDDLWALEQKGQLDPLLKA